MADTLRIERILVPIDGSEYSRFAAEHAVRIAQQYGAEVTFLHAVDDQLVGQLAQQEGEDSRQQTRARLHQNGEMYLHDVTHLASDRNLRHRNIIAEGDPCAVICDTAAQLQINLIVIGKIGRRGARRILVGSVTRRVIEGSDIPVLVVTQAPER